jgi:hypothetical protein
MAPNGSIAISKMNMDKLLETKLVSLLKVIHK